MRLDTRRLISGRYAASLSGLQALSLQSARVVAPRRMGRGSLISVSANLDSNTVFHGAPSKECCQNGRQDSWREQPFPPGIGFGRRKAVWETPPVALGVSSSTRRLVLHSCSEMSGPPPNPLRKSERPSLPHCITTPLYTSTLTRRCT